MTARGSEKGGAAHLRLRGEMMAAIKKRNAEESTLLAKQREEEAKLTSIYTAHRQQTDRLEFEIASKTNEQHEIGQAMTRFKGSSRDPRSHISHPASPISTGDDAVARPVGGGDDREECGRRRAADAAL